MLGDALMWDEIKPIVESSDIYDGKIDTTTRVPFAIRDAIGDFICKYEFDEKPMQGAKHNFTSELSSHIRSLKNKTLDEQWSAYKKGITKTLPKATKTTLSNRLYELFSESAIKERVLAEGPPIKTEPQTDRPQNITSLNNSATSTSTTSTSTTTTTTTTKKKSPKQSAKSNSMPVEQTGPQKRIQKTKTPPAKKARIDNKSERSAQFNKSFEHMLQGFQKVIPEQIESRTTHAVSQPTGTNESGYGSSLMALLSSQ